MKAFMMRPRGGRRWGRAHPGIRPGRPCPAPHRPNPPPPSPWGRVWAPCALLERGPQTHTHFAGAGDRRAVDTQTTHAAGRLTDRRR